MKSAPAYLTAVCLQLAATAIAADYHLNAIHGDDSNTGLSPDHAWKTLEKANTTEFAPGDKLLIAAGSVFKGRLELKGGGQMKDGSMVPAIVDRYGDGALPRIDAEGKFNAAVFLRGAEGWEIRNLELTNTGPTRENGRFGIEVCNDTLAVARHIVLSKLFIHDVNGAYPKHHDAGAAIRITVDHARTATRFDNLVVENCHIKDCSRNGIVIRGGALREHWNPSTNVVVRHNLIEGVGGDGILPCSCDGALIEWNTMRDCARYGEEGGAAAGIWPWSSDNTLIQFNEVSGHKAWIDGQAYDCDYNCNQTTYQYNYSHDNEGGFMLMCSPGSHETGWLVKNAWNRRSIVRYNLSINDGSRRSTGHRGNFAPIFSLSGETTRQSRIYRNIILIPKEAAPRIDSDLIEFAKWGENYPVDTTFSENIFWLGNGDRGTFKLMEAKQLTFEGNQFFGKVEPIREGPEITARGNLFQKRIPETVALRGSEDELRTFARFLEKKGNPHERHGLRIRAIVTPP